MENIREGKAQQALLRGSLNPPPRPRANAAASATSQRPAMDGPPAKKSKPGFSIPRRQPEQAEREPRDANPRPRPQSSSGGRSEASGQRARQDDSAPRSGRPSGSGKARGRGGNSEYISPDSFSQAWSEFFSAQAIMLVTSIGLVVSKIPALSQLEIGGRLRHCVSAWKSVTESKWIRNVVRIGYKIPLISKPFQSKIPTNPKVKPEAHQVLLDEAKGLLEKGAIMVSEMEEGQFVSSYFAVPKPRSDKWRPILNLKKFNENVKHYKFRMETFSQVRQWIQPNYFLVGLDLKDQFLSVPINKINFWHPDFHLYG